MTTVPFPREPRDQNFNMIGSLESTAVRFSSTRRTERQSNNLLCYINATGLVSVMLVLLVMFMVTNPVHSFHKGPPVDLAKVSSPVLMRGADREDAMIVVIMRDAKVFFRSGQVTAVQIRPDQLDGKIQESVSHGSERNVYIWADARAKYIWVSDVLYNVRSAGIEKVAFLVGQRQSPAANAQ